MLHFTTPHHAARRVAVFAVAFVSSSTIVLLPYPIHSEEQARTQFTVVSRVRDVLDFFSREKKRVLTFCGYSGSGYEHPEQMLQSAEAVLDKYDPKKTIVNCGATSMGIGRIYELAKRRGFATTGIVSILAKEYPDQISPHVDTVFYVQDESWGGFVDDTGRLSPTSQAMVSASDVMVAIGGGDVTRDELLSGEGAGKTVQFIPADMNHEKAIAKARKKKLPPPNDFRGTAHEVFGKP